jgi:epidermal growth factor receptor substrate 15
MADHFSQYLFKRITKTATDASLDQNNLNLSADEKRYYGQLFQQADTDRLGVVTGEIAVRFFEKTKVAPNVLGEVRRHVNIEGAELL